MTADKELSKVKLKDGETKLVAGDEERPDVELPDLGERYEVLELIGQGGMGKVYRVRDRDLDKVLAIKVLRRELSIDPGAVKRFEQEVKATSELTHQNLAAVYGHGTARDGTPFMLMEYLGENNLGRVLKEGSGLAVDRAMNIFGQVAEALQHAHQNGIVHRDLKPSNIILTTGDTSQAGAEHADSEVARVVDFGIAKVINTPGETMTGLTQTGDIFGSPLYMSPEQCDGEALDARSDIYSFGCVMFEVLCGTPPYSASNPFRIMMKHVNEPIPAIKRNDVPPQLKAIIAKCMEKLPADRYQNMKDLIEDLQQAKRREPLRHAGKPKLKFSKLHLPVIGMGLVAVSIGLFAITNLSGLSDNPNANPLALIPDAVAPGPYVPKQVQPSMVMFKPHVNKPTLQAMTILKGTDFGLRQSYKPLSDEDGTRLREYLRDANNSTSKGTALIAGMGPDVVPALVSHLDSTDDNLARSASIALGSFGQTGLQELSEKFKTSSNRWVAEGLQNMGDDGIKAVAPMLQDHDVGTRGRAAALMKNTVASWRTWQQQYSRELPADISNVLLWMMMNDSAVTIRADAASALCCAPVQGPLKQALSYIALNDPAPAVRAEAASSLIKVAQRYGDSSQQTLDMIGYLMQNDQSDQVKTSIIDTCRYQNDLTQKLMPYLRGAWTKASFDVKTRLLFTYMSLGPSAEGAVPDMIEALKDDRLREIAVNALSKVGPRGKEALPVLHDMISKQIPADTLNGRYELAKKQRLQSAVRKIMEQDPNAH